MALFRRAVSEPTSYEKLDHADLALAQAADHLAEAQELAASEHQANQSSAQYFANEANEAAKRKAKAELLLSSLPG